MPNTIAEWITRTLTDRGHRRQTIGAFFGSGLAVTRLGTESAAAKKKRRCRKRLESCGGKKKCCDKSGLNACREYPTANCQGLSGKRCCGLDGALCSRNDPPGNHCECCDGHFCSPVSLRCQAEFT